MRTRFNYGRNRSDLLRPLEAVPYSWLVDYGLGLDSDFETAAKGMGANGWSVWQSYVAGLDPTDALSQLTADITVGLYDLYRRPKLVVETIREMFHRAVRTGDRGDRLP